MPKLHSKIFWNFDNSLSIVYDSIQGLTYIWRTHVWKNYLGVKTVKIIVVYMFLGVKYHVFLDFGTYNSLFSIDFEKN